MPIFSKMSVRGKLVSAFFSIIILTILISAISLVQLFKTNDVIKYVHFILGTRYEAVSKIYYSMEEVDEICFGIQADLKKYSPEEEEKLMAKIATLKEATDFIDKTDTNNRKDVDPIAAGVKEYIALVNEKFIPTVQKKNAPMAQIIYEKSLFKVSDSVKSHTLAITKNQIRQTTGGYHRKYHTYSYYSGCLCGCCCYRSCYCPYLLGKHCCGPKSGSWSS